MHATVKANHGRKDPFVAAPTSFKNGSGIHLVTHREVTRNRLRREKLARSQETIRDSRRRIDTVLVREMSPRIENRFPDQVSLVLVSA
jgi:hypothetical protein